MKVLPATVVLGVSTAMGSAFAESAASAVDPTGETDGEIVRPTEPQPEIARTV